MSVTLRQNAGHTQTCRVFSATLESLALRRTLSDAPRDAAGKIPEPTVLGHFSLTTFCDCQWSRWMSLSAAIPPKTRASALPSGTRTRRPSGAPHPAMLVSMALLTLFQPAALPERHCTVDCARRRPQQTQLLTLNPPTETWTIPALPCAACSRFPAGGLRDAGCCEAR
jgi:hypothetical protein